MAAEGPLTGRGKSAYLINYRYSTVGLLGQMGINFGDETITFQDLSVNLAAPRTRAGDFRLFAMWGNSSNYFEHKADSASIELNKDIFNIDYTSRTLITGASWYKKLSSPLDSGCAHPFRPNQRTRRRVGRHCLRRISKRLFRRNNCVHGTPAWAISCRPPCDWKKAPELHISRLPVPHRPRYPHQQRQLSGGNPATLGAAGLVVHMGQTTVTGGLHSVWWLQNEVHLEPRLSIVQRLDDQQTISGELGAAQPDAGLVAMGFQVRQRTHPILPCSPAICLAFGRQHLAAWLRGL